MFLKDTASFTLDSNLHLHFNPALLGPSSGALSGDASDMPVSVHIQRQH
jgi:hypothetical protein